MSIYLSLIIGLITGFICSYYAQKRGRSQETWFCIGLFFGVVGLIVLFLLPSYEKKEEEPPAPAKMEAAAVAPDPQFQDWFFLSPGNAQNGPIAFRQLLSAWEEKKVTLETYVWTEGMPEWQRIASLPLLLKQLQTRETGAN